MPRINTSSGLIVLLVLNGCELITDFSHSSAVGGGGNAGENGNAGGSVVGEATGKGGIKSNGGNGSNPRLVTTPTGGKGPNATTTTGGTANVSSTTTSTSQGGTGGAVSSGGTTSGMGGSNIGGCSPGSVACINNVPQLCSNAGVWKAQTACAGDTPTCRDGNCVCNAGAEKCKSDNATPQFCNSSGVWQDRAVCGSTTPICNGAGVCGECKAQDKKCDNVTPYLCSTDGRWVAQTACGGAKPFCATGACTTTCPGSGGPMMKLLPEGYCIDTTEVTREQYQTWLASGATAKPTSQISDCAWNDSYLPSTDAHNDWPPVINIKAPVALIDWCDAYAYCIGVGKRLCGKIGGGPSSPNELSSQPNTNQWVNACSSHGVNDYATGDSYVIGTCNSNNADGGSNFVANMPDCQSPVTAYSGVYDLSGNVQEFIDTCDATSGMAAQCETSGGSFWFWDSQMMCTSSYLVRRDFKAAWIGFRCCSP